MKRFSISALSTAAILLASTAPIAIAPAKAAFSFNINFGFNTFRDRLGDRGRWVHNAYWGEVWQPRRRVVGDNFQPYTNGYWEYTDEYGWYWVSNDPFDDVVYHYGRWVYDPDMRWVWIPGYTWGPGWVVWREGGGYSGWMPMPPDENFVSGNGLSLGMDFGSWGVNAYGYNRWYGNRVDPGRFWVFVDNRNLAARDYRRFVVPRERTRVLITNTRNVTKYEVVNNRVVNRSVDVRVIERASGRRIAPVSARQVIKPNAIITTVDESNRVRERERVQHPIRTDVFKGQPGGANNNQPGNGNGRPGADNGGMPPNATPEGGKRDRDNNNGPGTGNGRPGTATGGMQQPPNAPEGGKRDRGNNNGPAANGPGATPPNGSGNEQSSTPKNDRQRDRSNTSPGSGNGAGSTPSGENGSSSNMEKPSRPSRGSANPGGAMTGPSGGEPSTTAPSDNTSPGTERPKRTPRNPGGAMTGPSPSQPSTTTPGDTATPPSAPPSDRATRGPRSITPPGGAMTSPSDNSQPQPPRHSRPAPNNPPGAATPPPSGASDAQQPDNSGNEPKKKKRNPQDQTPPPPQ